MNQRSENIEGTIISRLTRTQHGLNSARFDNVIEFIVKEKRNFVEPIVEDDGKTSLLRSGAGFQV